MLKKNRFISSYFSLTFSSEFRPNDDLFNGLGRYWKILYFGRCSIQAFIFGVLLKKYCFILSYFSLIFSSKTWIDDVINGSVWYWMCNLLDIAFIWYKSMPQAIVLILFPEWEFINNWGKIYYKLWQLFITNWSKVMSETRATFLIQIGAKFITNWGKFHYKLKL